MKNTDDKYKMPQVTRLELAQDLITNLSDYGLTQAELAEIASISLASLKKFRQNPTMLERQRWSKTEYLIQLWCELELEKINKNDKGFYIEYIKAVFDKRMQTLSREEKLIMQACKDVIVESPENLVDVFYQYQEEKKRKVSRKRDAVDYLVAHREELSEEDWHKIEEVLKKLR